VGCALIGYMAWVLATSVTVRQFLSGNLVFTYTIIGVGFVLFMTGLLGWVGASSSSACILRMYIMAVVLSIAFEVGGILTLSILRIDLGDIIENGWGQVNQATRNAVQDNFNCCGYSGPKEFAYQNDPIDDSCYEDTFLMTTTALPEMSIIVPTSERSRILKQHGCSKKLQDWFENNRVIWVTIMAAIGLIQAFGVICAIYVINRIQAIRHAQMVNDMEELQSTRFSSFRHAK